MQGLARILISALKRNPGRLHSRSLACRISRCHFLRTVFIRVTHDGMVFKQSKDRTGRIKAKTWNKPLSCDCRIAFNKAELSERLRLTVLNDEDAILVLRAQSPYHRAARAGPKTKKHQNITPTTGEPPVKKGFRNEIYSNRNYVTFSFHESQKSPIIRLC